MKQLLAENHTSMSANCIIMIPSGRIAATETFSSGNINKLREMEITMTHVYNRLLCVMKLSGEVIWSNSWRVLLFLLSFLLLLRTEWHTLIGCISSRQNTSRWAQSSVSATVKRLCIDRQPLRQRHNGGESIRIIHFYITHKLHRTALSQMCLCHENRDKGKH